MSLKSKKAIAPKKTAHSHRHHHKPHKPGANEASVEKILARAQKPLSAYDIIPLMPKKSGHAVAPVTVYRALQNLAEQGIVTRIESQNAYILCRHPDEEHACLFFICRKCGSATEGHDEGVRGLLAKEAKSLGFGIDKPILEVVGLCRNCVKKAA